MTVVFSERISLQEQLTGVVGQVLQQLTKGSLLLLSGDLAAGKTTFVNEFCRSFGIKITQSPTYAICNVYSTSDVRILHFDLYRLESEDAIHSSGFYDLLRDPADYKLIEWSERIDLNDYPVDMIKYGLDFKINADGSRQLTFVNLS